MNDSDSGLLLVEKQGDDWTSKIIINLSKKTPNSFENLLG